MIDGKTTHESPRIVTNLKRTVMAELLMKDEVYALVGEAMEVYNELGNGFLEAVYQEAFEIELQARALPFHAQQLLPIVYKNQALRKEYKADIIAFDKIIVELKAEECLTKNDEAQLLNYLNATRLQVGLLLNFGAAKNLEWKRMILKI
jgi:GxxExxY protein